MYHSETVVCLVYGNFVVIRYLLDKHSFLNLSSQKWKHASCMPVHIIGYIYVYFGQLLLNLVDV